MTAKCSNCFFFRRNPQDLKQGACHKAPPQAALVPGPRGIAVLANWPPVEPETGWCGEHKPALQVQ